MSSCRSGDTVIVAYSNDEKTQVKDEKVLQLLGLIRLEVAKHLRETGDMEEESTDPHFLWVTDFPLLELNVRFSNGFVIQNMT